MFLTLSLPYFHHSIPSYRSAKTKENVEECFFEVHRLLRVVNGEKVKEKESKKGGISQRFTSIFKRKKEKSEERKEMGEEKLDISSLWGFDPKYISYDKYEYELVCLICERICRDAVKIECKGEGISLLSFCEKCLLGCFEKHRKSKGRCPIKSHGIHEKKPIIRPNSTVRERISWLKAGCPNNG